MTKAPGESPGSSPFGEKPAYRRPGLALTIAAIGYVATVVLLFSHPAVQSSLASSPPWLRRLVDLAVLSAPLVVAVIVAGRFAADGIGRATGIRQWRWFDPVLGLLVAAEARALVELVAPTTGTLLGPLDTELTADVIAGAIVLVVGVVLISPLIEELFFRGLLLRAFDDALRDAGRIVGPVVALLVSTAAFSLLHMLPLSVQLSSGVSTGLLVGTLGVGIGCGILTYLTRRLGAAICAHVAFNAMGVWLLVT